jgi:hypothetical protein
MEKSCAGGPKRGGFHVCSALCVAAVVGCLCILWFRKELVSACMPVHFWMNGLDWDRAVRAARNVDMSEFHSEEYIRRRMLELLRIVRRDTLVPFRMTLHMRRLRKMAREGVVERDMLEIILGAHLDQRTTGRIERETGMVVV